ncbi:hypothetical protein ACJDU8_01765 [Clostridium sp. WILCCON 0269]|uniref:Lipoprotein n=1 Tax=Candidatus Clostridium eludens TaxID=3381663 RepID=A0ABW8SE64_9CLOT
MKKFLSIITIVIISISLASCGTKNASNTGTNSKITYTKELTYFPSYDGMKSSKYTPPSKKSPFATARYTIKNTSDSKVYQYYEDALKKDGWTITDEKQHFAISAKKDTHMANILIQKSGKDILLIVISK